MGSFYQEMNPAVIVDRPVSNLDSEHGKLLGARLAVCLKGIEKKSVCLMAGSARHAQVLHWQNSDRGSNICVTHFSVSLVSQVKPNSP